MPYISDDARIDLALGNAPAHAGELTYDLSQTVLRYLGSTPRFQAYAEVLGALEATKLELYRRALAPYEDAAAERNGDLTWPTP